MDLELLPRYFPLLFGAAVVVVCAYLACVFALMQRLKAPHIVAKGYVAPNFFGSSGSLKLMQFLFGERHRHLEDPVISKLVWAARVAMIVYLPLFVLVVITSVGAN